MARSNSACTSALHDVGKLTFPTFSCAAVPAMPTTIIRDRQSMTLRSFMAQTSHPERGVEDGVAPVFGAVREVELGRERRLAGGLDLHVDVPRPTRVLRGHDGFETVAARLVG